MFERCLQSLLVFLLLSSFKGFSQQVTLAPEPSWILLYEADITVSPKVSEAGGYYYVHIEQQEHVRKQESFIHNAYKFLTSEGIQEMADININFDPSYQKLIFHKLIIHREGKKIDHLTKNAIRTIQREQDMDRYIYDGSLTAIINLKDIRIGDVIEYAYTLKGYNPIYDGHVAHQILLNYSIPYEKGIKRLIAPSDTRLFFKYKNNAPKPVEETVAGMTSYTWISEKISACIEDNNVPSWYDPYQRVQVTDFENWSEVVKWSIKHFELKQAQLSSLEKRIQVKWRDIAVSEKEILEIIRFVQDEIRYLGFEGGLNSHKPHAPVKVFDQRFGDCKDKSLLLSAILQQKGISAYPMLVNTSLREYLSELLPTVHAFDHCVVEIDLDGKKIYVDPTINNQGGTLQNIFFPNYGKGLLIRDGQTDLIQLPKAPLGGIQEVDTLMLTTTADTAVMSVRTTYKGGDADSQRSYFASNSLEAVQKSYVNFYGNLYPEITADALLKTQDDRDNNIFTVEEKYKVPAFWKEKDDNKNQKQSEFYSLSIENLVNVAKSSQRKSPHRLSYPTSYQHTIFANLPAGWNVKSQEKNIASEAYMYRYEASAMGNNLRIYHHYLTATDHIPVADISKFVKDHEDIMNNLSYVVSFTNNDNANELTGNFRLLPVTVGLISMTLAILLIGFLYFKYDPPRANGITKSQPIGGWLVLVAIGLSLTPLRLLFNFFQTTAYFDHNTWSNLWSSENWILFSLYLFEYVHNIFFFFFSILLITLFFKRRSSIPLLITIFYGASVAVTLLDAIIGMTFKELYTDSDRYEFYRNLFRSSIAAAIWIPYFKISGRVKETFVERLEPRQGSDNTVTYTFRN